MVDELHGSTHWSFLATGTACHHTCVLAEMRRLADENMQLMENLKIESERCHAQTLEIARLNDKVAQSICDEQSSTEALVSALDEIERLETLIVNEDGFHGDDPVYRHGDYDSCPFCAEIEVIKAKRGSR